MTMTLRRLRMLGAPLLLSLLLSAASAQAAPADEIKALIENGNSPAAYTLGKKHPEQLGNPAFDFYFGIAAVDSGHAGEGVLALERYVVNFPDNRQARLELARGYFVLGEDLRAREEFSDILKTSPPPDVVANINRYLDAIRARESSYRTTAGAYLEFGLGYDSNINGGVGSANVNLPNLGLVTIVPAGVEIGRSFSQAVAGANIVVPVAPGIATFGSISGDYKMHSNDREFDQGNIGAAGGFSYLSEKNLYRGTASYSNLEVDYRRFRDVSALTGEWMHQLDELQGINGSLQWADLDYSGNNDIRDSRLYSLGAGYRRAFIGRWSPMLTLSGGYSVEDNLAGRDDLGRDIYSLRVGLSGSPAPRWSVGGSLGFQSSHYAAQDVLFATTRRDSYLSADVAVGYAVSRSLSVRGELLLSSNRSNIDLYDYRRDVVAAKVRYEFK
jgi:hypothetical protein